MSERSARLVALRTCSKAEQKLLFMLRALIAGAAWRSQAIHEFATMGIDSESSFVFLHLMTLMERMTPSLTILAPRAPAVSVDELNLLTLLRRSAGRASIKPASLGDLGFSMPDELIRVFGVCGDRLRRSGIRMSPRPILIDGWSLSTGVNRMVDESASNARILRATKIISNEVLNPRMRRLRLTGRALAGWSDAPPGQWVKVFPAIPGDSTGDVPIGRVYTIRAFDVETNTLTIDVALHGGGSVSTWLEHAKVGDDCAVAGARGGFEGVPRDCEHLILAGDETAIPAIASILEKMPAETGATAFIDVANKDCAVVIQHSLNASVHWLPRDASAPDVPSPLPERVVAHCAFHRNAYVWAAGEASVMRELRKSLVTSLQHEARRIHTVGYWKKGETDHRDASAG